MSIAHETTSPAQASLTPLGEACSTCNLTAIHEILEKAGYKEDEGIANEVSTLRIPQLEGGKTFLYQQLPLDFEGQNLCETLLLLQLSFQMWANQIQETLNTRKAGDSAFRDKDFATAIKCYTQVSNQFGNCT